MSDWVVTALERGNVREFEGKKIKWKVREFERLSEHKSFTIS